MSLIRPFQFLSDGNLKTMAQKCDTVVTNTFAERIDKPIRNIRAPGNAKHRQKLEWPNWGITGQYSHAAASFINLPFLRGHLGVSGPLIVPLNYLVILHLIHL